MTGGCLVTRGTRAERNAWLLSLYLGVTMARKLVTWDIRTEGNASLSLYLEVTLTGGCLVTWDTRKFMARSSQFISSSTISLSVKDFRQS